MTSHTEINHPPFIAKLVKEAPSLGPILSEHIEDYEEVLEHVFIADVAKHFIEMLETKGNMDELSNIVSGGFKSEVQHSVKYLSSWVG